MFKFPLAGEVYKLQKDYRFLASSHNLLFSLVFFSVALENTVNAERREGASICHSNLVLLEIIAYCY